MRPTLAALRRSARAHFTDPTRRRGLLVAFEGPDGSGKTTQRKLFKTWLKSEGYDVVTTKWNSSDLIKPIIKSRKAVRALSPEEFSLLHGADFRHRVEQVILPALWDGKLVIADRFLFTGLARDVARGLDLDWVLKLYQPLLWPDLVFYFSVSPVTSGKRVTAMRHAELLRGRPGRHAGGRPGRELPALHRARDPRVRIAGADLQHDHGGRRAVDRRTAPPDPAAVPRGPGAAVVRLERGRRRRVAGDRRGNGAGR